MNTSLNKVVVFGDSLFKGIIYDIDKNRYRVQKPCVNTIIEKANMEFDNYSRFGMTSEKVLKLFKEGLLQNHRYRYAVIELGGNDSDHTWEEISHNPNNIHYPKVKLIDFEINMQKIVENLRKNGIIPLIVTMPPISSNKYFNWFSKNLNKNNLLEWLKDEKYIYTHHEMYSICLSNLAHKLNVQILDLRMSLLTMGDYERYLCVDGIHLNEDGHKLIEQSFKKGDLKNG